MSLIEQLKLKKLVLKHGPKLTKYALSTIPGGSIIADIVEMFAEMKVEQLESQESEEKLKRLVHDYQKKQGIQIKELLQGTKKSIIEIHKQYDLLEAKLNELEASQVDQAEHTRQLEICLTNIKANLEHQIKEILKQYTILVKKVQKNESDIAHSKEQILDLNQAHTQHKQRADEHERKIDSIYGMMDTFIKLTSSPNSASTLDHQQNLDQINLKLSESKLDQIKDLLEKNLNEDASIKLEELQNSLQSTNVFYSVNEAVARFKDRFVLYTVITIIRLQKISTLSRDRINKTLWRPLKNLSKNSHYLLPSLSILTMVKRDYYDAKEIEKEFPDLVMIKSVFQSSKYKFDDEHLKLLKVTDSVSRIISELQNENLDQQKVLSQYMNLLSK